MAARWGWSSGTLVTLSIPVLDLYALADRLGTDGTAHHAFCEPDLANELTAIAVLAPARLRRELGRYPLLLATSRSETSPFAVGDSAQLQQARGTHFLFDELEEGGDTDGPRTPL